VQYALRHGVPIVASGGQEDKPEVGARVAWSGVGRRLTPLSPRPAALRAAIHEVLRDPRYRRAAAAMAERMALSGGLPALAAVVDAVLRAPAGRAASHAVNPAAHRRVPAAAEAAAGPRGRAAVAPAQTVYPPRS
jgi:UDP:flavonoid glycosyltransferase YjiC (YdhE family)